MTDRSVRKYYSHAKADANKQQKRKGAEIRIKERRQRTNKQQL